MRIFKIPVAKPAQLRNVSTGRQTGERWSNNFSDPRGCGMPLKTQGEPVFMASVI